MTDIAASMPEVEHILFDYNEIDMKRNTMTVIPLEQQARRLEAQLNALDDGTQKVIDIVAHSQGCVVAALARPSNVRRVVCITPPDSLDIDRMVRTFDSRPGSHINLEGESLIPRRDGTTTVIPKEYWQSLRLDVPSLYNRLADLAEKVTFYLANDDEVLGPTNFDHIDKRIELIQLDGGHNFTGAARPKITAAVCEALQL